MLTVVLLITSNIFMTFAWYGHLKFFPNQSVVQVVLISWGIAFFEYCLMVPANRLGYFTGNFSGYQLKVLQEMITLSVFIIFSNFVLGEQPQWKYLLSFGCLVMAGVFAFW